MRRSSTVFVFLLCAVYCGCAVLTSGFQGTGAGGYFRFVKKQCTVPFFVVLVMIAAIAVGVHCLLGGAAGRQPTAGSCL